MFNIGLVYLLEVYHWYYVSTRGSFRDYGRVNTAMSSVTMAAMPVGQMLFGFLFDKIDA